MKKMTLLRKKITMGKMKRHNKMKKSWKKIKMNRRWKPGREESEGLHVT